MSEFNEETNVGTETGDLDQIMDTSISDTALEFVKENAAALAVLGFAAKGVYDTGKWAVNKIKTKLPAKDKPAKPSIRERIKARTVKKKEKPEEEKAE